MAWDDFGFDSGSGSDFGSFDAFSGGSYSPMDYSGLSLGGAGGSGFNMGDMNAFSPNSGNFSQGGLDSSFLNQFSQQPGLGQPTGMTGQPQFQLPQGQPQMQQPGAGGFMGALPHLLGAGGGLASIIGQMVGGGQGQQQQRTLNNAGQGALNSANSMNAVAGTGQLPLQQMQMSLLQALQSGQGLPPGYQQLIEQAFQPQMGDLYTQAAQMGQARGFHDAPATSPPGGAILGPGLSNLQGQMAQAKLGLMQSLPQTFQNPINSQLNALGGASQGLQQTAMLNSGQQSQQPIAPMIGNQIGSMMQGAGQAMNMGSSQRIAMAQGGIVTQPTNALIGEAGPEAVIPLGQMPPQLMQILQMVAASNAGNGWQDPRYDPGMYRGTSQPWKTAPDPKKIKPLPGR